MECPSKRIKLDETVAQIPESSLHEINNDPEENGQDQNDGQEKNNPRELMILDELNDNDGDDQEDGDGAGSEFGSSGSEINYDDEIETLLDERLPEELKNKKKNQQYEERFKTVMEGKS